MDAIILQLLNGLDKGGAYALIALGLTLIFGTLGVVNFAHGALFMLGAFCAVTMQKLLTLSKHVKDESVTFFDSYKEVPYLQSWFGDFGLTLIDYAVPLSILLAIPVMLLLGVAMERGLIRHFYRRPHADQILVTFGLAIVLQEIVKSYFGANPIPTPAPELVSGSANVGAWLGLGDTIIYPWWRLVYFGFAALVIAAVFAFLRHTTFGMVVRAGMRDRETVGLLGINIERRFTIVFGIAVVVAGMAGAMYTPILPPDYHMGMDFLVLSFVVVVVGGMGSLPGAVAAGFLLGILQSIASMNVIKHLVPGIDQIIIYAVAVIVLLVRPRGLFGRKGLMGELTMLALTPKNDHLLFGAFAVAVLTMPLWLAPIGASYPDLMQKFAIYGIFAIGFNILFGLTGYLSFGHAAFLGVGSYTAVWSFKLLSMNVLPAVILGVLVAGVFALAIGYVSLRRSGIYFAILTLAFAQMSYNLAYSVLTPITNGETGLQLARNDPRALDQLLGEVAPGLGDPNLFGLPMSGYGGFYFCAVMLIVSFYSAMRITRSPFGMMLKAIKSNQNRLAYTGVHTRPYALTAFVISGCFAGLAGSLLAVTDPLAGAERMQWTASGEVVLMTILGGVGTLLGPVLGAAIIKYFENIFSSFNAQTLREFFGFLPDALENVVVPVSGLFVGEGWNLTLGALFMIVVIFLPGGVMEGIRRMAGVFRHRTARREAGVAPTASRSAA